MGEGQSKLALSGQRSQSRDSLSSVKSRDDNNQNLDSDINFYVKTIKDMKKEIHAFEGGPADPKFKMYQMTLAGYSQRIQTIRGSVRKRKATLCDNMQRDINDCLKALDDHAQNPGDPSNTGGEERISILKSPTPTPTPTLTPTTPRSPDLLQVADVAGGKPPTPSSRKTRAKELRFEEIVIEQLDEKITLLCKNIDGDIELELDIEPKQYDTLIRSYFTELELITNPNQVEAIAVRKERLCRQLIKYNHRVNKYKKSRKIKAEDVDPKVLQVVYDIQKQLKELRELTRSDSYEKDADLKAFVEDALKEYKAKVYCMDDSNKEFKGMKKQLMDQILAMEAGDRKTKTLQGSGGYRDEKKLDGKIAQLRDLVEEFDGIKGDEPFNFLDQTLRGIWAKLNAGTDDERIRAVKEALAMLDGKARKEPEIVEDEFGQVLLKMQADPESAITENVLLNGDIKSQATVHQENVLITPNTRNDAMQESQNDLSTKETELSSSQVNGLKEPQQGGEKTGLLVNSEPVFTFSEPSQSANDPALPLESTDGPTFSKMSEPITVPEELFDADEAIKHEIEQFAMHWDHIYTILNDSQTAQNHLDDLQQIVEIMQNDIEKLCGESIKPPLEFAQDEKEHNQDDSDDVFHPEPPRKVDVVCDESNNKEEEQMEEKPITNKQVIVKRSYTFTDLQDVQKQVNNVSKLLYEGFLNADIARKTLDEQKAKLHEFTLSANETLEKTKSKILNNIDSTYMLLDEHVAFLEQEKRRSFMRSQEDISEGLRKQLGEFKGSSVDDEQYKNLAEGINGSGELSEEKKLCLQQERLEVMAKNQELHNKIAEFKGVNTDDQEYKALEVSIEGSGGNKHKLRQELIEVLEKNQSQCVHEELRNKIVEFKGVNVDDEDYKDLLEGIKASGKLSREQKLCLQKELVEVLEKNQSQYVHKRQSAEINELRLIIGEVQDLRAHTDQLDVGYLRGQFEKCLEKIDAIKENNNDKAHMAKIQIKQKIFQYISALSSEPGTILHSPKDEQKNILFESLKSHQDNVQKLQLETVKIYDNFDVPSRINSVYYTEDQARKVLLAKETHVEDYIKVLKTHPESPFKQIEDIRHELIEVRAEMDRFNGTEQDPAFEHVQEKLVGCEALLDKIPDGRSTIIRTSVGQYRDHIARLRQYFKAKVQNAAEEGDDDGDAEESVKVKEMQDIEMKINELQIKFNLDNALTPDEERVIYEELTVAKIRLEYLQITDGNSADLQAYKDRLMKVLLKLLKKYKTMSRRFSATAGGANKEMMELVKIKGELMDIDEGIRQFSGTKNDKRYAELDEALVALVIRVNRLEVGDDVDMKEIKKELIQRLQGGLNELHDKSLAQNKFIVYNDVPGTEV